MRVPWRRLGHDADHDVIHVERPSADCPIPDVAEAQSVHEPGVPQTVAPDTIRSIVAGCQPQGGTTLCERAHDAPGGHDAKLCGSLYNIAHASTPAGLIVTQLVSGSDAG